MLMRWPQATPSCEHLQKSGFNEFLTLLLLIHYLQVQYVRLIVRSRPLWIDRLMIEPSNSGSGSVLKSWTRSSHSGPCVFCLINKHWSFPSAWSIPAVRYGLESGLCWERRREPGGGGGGTGCALTQQEPGPLTPPPRVATCLPFVIQSIIFDHNCQPHSCHTLPVCVFERCPCIKNLQRSEADEQPIFGRSNHENVALKWCFLIWGNAEKTDETRVRARSTLHHGILFSPK